ncbi:hypothetical protein [Brevundimonas diminuta]|uniref:hypothetical protein n=1 Tax=Brevundimonas diminuta TaxID=293 RepID=UPI003D9A9283
MSTNTISGLAPIGLQAVPAAVKKIANSALIHPNVQKMHDAVDRWIKEANTRGGQAGVAYLALCRARVQQNFENLAAWADDKGELRRGMAGITVGHLDAVRDRLGRAARRLEGVS